jgi:penicillin-binding protein
MEKKQRYKEKGGKDRKGKGWLLWCVIAAATVTGMVGLAVYAAVFWGKKAAGESPGTLLTRYMAYIPEKEYDRMYDMLDEGVTELISREDFVKRNAAIYEGIGVQHMAVEITAYDEEQETVVYRTSFDTLAGNISFENRAFFQKGKNSYGLVWEDSLIFPELGPTDKVRVSTNRAERGKILDRNGRVLADKGTASSVGIVPGKLADGREAIEEIAGLLEIEPESIEKKLSAGWVKEDSFVPVKTVPKVEETERRTAHPGESVQAELDRQEKLLAIPGVMLSDVEVRSYPLGEAAAHLIGYVQSVTAEDLEEHAGEGYTVGSVIGRNGMEGLFEKELRGQDGCRIYIEDAGGREKAELAVRLTRQGQDVQLTVDAGLQAALYEQFQSDKSCSVAIDPYTGEVLALVSTPAYDNNDFIRGLSEGQWKALNENEDQPMVNRFRQAWCPGSTFKAITAAVGLESGDIDPAEDYGNEGLRWQKDASWGSYYVTTLHEGRPSVLENALVCSDNIYFAKAALKIGAEKWADAMAGLGFKEEIPFEIKMSPSQYSNTEVIETEIQMADSGYGQGQMLVNPLHLACLYSAFCNEGNMIRPYLVYRQEAEAAWWISEAFSPKTAGQVREAMIKVVNSAEGTGYGARRDDVVLAGKTGTAEIKAAKEDDSGTELGWFAVFTAEKTAERPVLLVSMTEDVKDRGGSGYVVEKDRLVLEAWFGDGE